MTDTPLTPDTLEADIKAKCGEDRNTSASPDTWVVKKMPGFRISHPFMAVTPGCPTSPHPTRWCKCKVFRSNADATKYTKEQGTS